MSELRMRRRGLVAAALLLLASGCDRPAGGGKVLPGDSLSSRPAGPPAVAGEPVSGTPPPPGGRGPGGATSADAARGAAGSSGPASGGGAPAGGVCSSDLVNREQIRLVAEWRDGHLRVQGTVGEGNGKILNLGLSQGGRFVYDEVFRAERLASLRLRSDSVEATSVSYEPTPAELGAFARTGAVELDRAGSVCLDASVYDGLTLKAVNRLELAPPGP